MIYNPEKYNRRSIRLKGYDYTQPGGYFVTICTNNREKIFGDITDGRMLLNTFGEIIDYHWKRIPTNFNHVSIDEYQIMPNHFHGIIRIAGAMHSVVDNVNQCRSSSGNASPLHTAKSKQLPPNGTTPGSLGAIMQNFQSITSRKINRIRKTPGVSIWQRNFWDHIIRNENDLNRIRKYIIGNPMKWFDDDFFCD